MRKIYSVILVALLMLVGLSANAINVTVNIDNPENLTVKVSYSVIDVVAGDNVFDVPEYGQIDFTAKDGYFLTGVVKSIKGQDDTALSIYNMTQCYAYVYPSDEGATYTVTTQSADDTRDGYCTITVVDDVSNVQVQRSTTYTYVNLAVGVNTVKFATATELPLMIGPKTYNTQLYQVKLNNEVVAPQGSVWRISPATGDNIEITANFPDVDVPVHFTFANEESAGAISSVTVDGTPVDNYAADDFTVKAGKTIAINFNNSDYSIDAFKVNGTQTSVYGSYNQVISDETTFDITAHKYGTVKATLNLDDAANVKVFKGYSYQDILFEGLHDGANEIEVSETNTIISIQPASGSFITSVTSVVGEEEPVSYSADYSNSYCITVREGMVINVVSGGIVRDKKAIVYIDEKSAASQYFSFTRADRSEVDLQTGYNEIEFADSDNPFLFSWYGPSFNNVYLNEMPYSPQYEGSASYQASFADGDILKIYIASAPEYYTITVGASKYIDESRVDVLVDHISKVATLDGQSRTVLHGTEVLIAPEEGYGVVVKANNEPVAPQADGSTIVTITGNTDIALYNATEGVDTIAVDENAEKVIYNLQGIRINNNDINNLPAGIYVVNGKKIFVR